MKPLVKTDRHAGQPHCVCVCESFLGRLSTKGALRACVRAGRARQCWKHHHQCQGHATSHCTGSGASTADRLFCDCTECATVSTRRHHTFHVRVSPARHTPLINQPDGLKRGSR